MWRFYLILLSALAVFMPELSGQGIERADFLSPNANQFLDQLPAPLSAAAEKIYPDGTIVLSPSSSASQPSLLQMIESPASSTFALAREGKSRFDSQAVYRRYQQYHHGIKVDGGGYTVKLLPGAAGGAQVRRFAPNVFYGIEVPLEPTVGQQALAGILGVPGITAAELIISDRYGGSFRLLWEVSYTDGGLQVALVDAHSEEVVHTYSGIAELTGTTETYGQQLLNGLEQGGITYMITPNEQIKIYEFATPPDEGFSDVSPWPSSLIPTTSGATWDGAASPLAIQAMYTTGLAVPAFSSIGINFGTVHVGVDGDTNARAWPGSTTDVASISFGRLQGRPTALFDITAHELGHCFLFHYLDYDSEQANRSLHEGISDILGTYIESLIQPQGVDWVMGDDEPAIASSQSRDLSVLACLDDLSAAGMHARGLVIGHWYYLLSVGGLSFGGGNIVSLGMEDALMLLLESLEGLDNPKAGFPQMRLQTLITAAELFGVCSPKYRSVVNAWAQVCVAGPSEGCPCDSYPAPSLSATAAASECPAASLDLNAFYAGTPPQGASLAWVVEDEPVPNGQAFKSGAFRAYYYNESADCYGPASTALNVVIDCCEPAPDLHISEDIAFSGNLAFGGNIIVQAGATLTFDGAWAQFYAGKSITVESGGKLVLSLSTLASCAPPTTWGGIVVLDGGGLEALASYIYSGSNGVDAKAGSTVDINTLNIEGPKSYTGTGLFLDGAVNAPQLRRLKITGYRHGIRAQGGGLLYHLDEGEMDNILFGLLASEASVVMRDYLISGTAFGLLLSNSPGSVIENNQIGYALTGIQANFSPFTRIAGNTIGWPGQSGSRGISMYLSGGSRIEDNPQILAANRGISLWSSPSAIIDNYLEVLGNNNQSGGGIELIEGAGYQVKGNYLTVKQSAFGVEANNCTGTEIKNNDISLFSTISARTAAIRSMGSSAEEIEYNIINGVANTTETPRATSMAAITWQARPKGSAYTTMQSCTTSGATPLMPP